MEVARKPLIFSDGIEPYVLHCILTTGHIFKVVGIMNY